MARKLIVEIAGDTSSLERAFKRAEHSSRGFGSRVGAGFATLARGAAVAGAAVGAGLAVAAKIGIDELKESQLVAAQTAAVLKSTGGAANVTAAQIGNLATSLSRMSGVDDEAIQASENLLATFTNIRNEVGKGNDIFNQATKAVLDMSVALGEDSKSASIQLGKALNDPIKGITALRRVGVAFTDQQQDQIKALVASGDTLSAQKLILAELTKEFGGSAKAAGDTFAGAINKAKNAIQEMLGTLAQAFAPALQAAAQGLANLALRAQPLVAKALPQISAAFQRIAQVAREVWPTVQNLIVGAWRFIQANVIPVVVQLARIVVDEWRAIAAVIRKHQPELERIGSRLAALFRVFAQVAVPIIRLVLTQVLPRAIGIAITVIDKFSFVIEKVTGVLVALFSKALAGISGFLKGVGALASIGRRLHIPGFEGIEKGANAARGAIDRLREVVRGVGKDGITAGKGLESIGVALTKAGRKLDERNRKRQAVPRVPRVTALPAEAVPKTPAKAKTPKVRVPRAARPRLTSLEGARVGTVQMTARVVNLNADRVVMKGTAGRTPALASPGGRGGGQHLLIGTTAPITSFPIRPLDVRVVFDGETVARSAVDPMRTLESRTPYLRRGRFAGSSLTAA